jgi:DnaJ-class molecular chaperone
MKNSWNNRKLLNVDKTAELKDLKTIYRNSMKECHPDKFQGDEAGLKRQKKKANKLLRPIILVYQS